jgi:ABC-type glycerol-3-phosphate transport system permease component
MAQGSLTINPRWPLVGAGKLVAYLVMVVSSLLVAYPLIAVLFDSFKTQVQFFNNPWSWPTSLDLSN